MIKEIKLPEIAENIDSATVLSILVSKGDKIKEDDNIAEMESDKAAFDLPSDVAGEIKEIKVNVGDEVKVGQVVMTVETDTDENEEEEKDKESKEESDADQEKEKSESESEKEIEKKKEKKSEKKEQDTAEDKSEEKEDDDHQDHEKKDKHDSDKEAEEEDRKEKTRETSADDDEEEGKEDDTHDEEDVPKKEAGEDQDEQEEQEYDQAKEKKEVAAAPSIRRLARELGIDIYKVEGTGPGDRITAEDVKAYSKEIALKSSDKASIRDEYELPDFSKYGSIERKPLNSIRKRIADNMQASWQSIPHVFQFDKADITNLETFRKKYDKVVEKAGGKLTITAILLKIMAQALKTFPNFNASLDPENDEIIFKNYYHIGVAVDTERGLLVPVIKDVDKKSIISLAIELGEIAEKTRNKKIKPDELQGGNIAISNLGGIGGTSFTPIIYRPNVAVLGVSQTRTEPLYIDGEFKPRQMLPLSLSYDHRAIDGAEGARFLRWFCEALENPLLTMFNEG
jgi:pyruvate dehydrogenase E2 component (dihydrolipoamide acetyltransferase)